MPDPLPPQPALDLTTQDLIARKERADQALGRLDGITMMLPDPQLFLYQYVRKEALLSSQIEGTQSSLSDLLLFELGEAPGVPLDDVEEVSNYVAAQPWACALTCGRLSLVVAADPGIATFSTPLQWRLKFLRGPDVVQPKVALK